MVSDARRRALIDEALDSVSVGSFTVGEDSVGVVRARFVSDPVAVPEKIGETNAPEHETLGLAEPRGNLRGGFAFLLDHILEGRAFIGGGHRQLLVFSEAELDAVWDVREG